MIVDMGGGTTDITIANKQGSEFNVLASDGDKKLGGKDVDDALLAWVCDAFKGKHGQEVTREKYPAEMFTILEEVRRAKHGLFAKQEAKVAVRVDAQTIQLSLGRDKLADMIKPLTNRLEELILTTESKSGVRREELKVLLVGGSTRLTPVRDLIKRIYGQESILGGKVSPDQAVCLGASIHAAKCAVASNKILVDQEFRAIPEPLIKHTDVTAHGLGVAILDLDTGNRIMSEILKQNTPIPCKASKEYGSLRDDQTGFLIEVLQGRNEQLIAECLVVARKEIHLPARSNSKPSIDVTMAYDKNNMCHVTVFDRVSKNSEEITVDFSQNAKKERS